MTSLDITNAYFVIPLTEESKEKTSFYVDDHIYMWDRMTHGLNLWGTTYIVSWMRRQMRG